jgi:hypothetical protein
MPSQINQVATAAQEIVLAERVVTTEWRVTRIVEDIVNRFVRVEVELGPFTQQDGPGGSQLRGSGGRNFVIWENEAYDAIRDTWANADLLDVLATKITA